MGVIAYGSLLLMAACGQQGSRRTADVDLLPESCEAPKGRFDYGIGGSAALNELLNTLACTLQMVSSASKSHSAF